MKLDFWGKKSCGVIRSQKAPKMVQKCFWSFDKTLIYSYVLFYFNIKVLTILYFSAKITYLRKIWFLSYGPKTLDQSECNILQTATSHKQVEVWTWNFVCDQTPIEATDLLSGFGQAYLGMLKVILNSESGLSAKWVEP